MFSIGLSYNDFFTVRDALILFRDKGLYNIPATMEFFEGRLRVFLTVYSIAEVQSGLVYTFEIDPIHRMNAYAALRLAAASTGLEKFSELSAEFIYGR